MNNHHLGYRFRSSAGDVAFGSAGCGPDVVLVHGTPTNSVIWHSVIEQLRADYRLYFLDLPGYGASEMREGQDVRLRALARVVREFVEHLRLDRPHLVGHDFGAAAVLGAHLVESVAVASLVIADGVVLNPWGTPFSLHMKNYERVFAAIPDYVHRAVLGAHLGTAVSRPLPQDLKDALISPWSGSIGQAAYYRQIAQYDHEFTAQLERLYPSLKIPTLILWGDEDQCVDIGVGRRLRELIPEAEMQVLPGAGHFSMLDAPDVFANHLVVWLASAHLPHASRVA